MGRLRTSINWILEFPLTGWYMLNICNITVTVIWCHMPKSPITARFLDVSEGVLFTKRDGITHKNPLVQPSSCRKAMILGHKVSTPMTDPAGAGRLMLTFLGGISWWDPWHTINMAPLGSVMGHGFFHPFWSGPSMIPGSFLSKHLQHGSLNVPIEHHPTIRYMVYNGYYKVMSNIPKMGHLPTPVQTSPFALSCTPACCGWSRRCCNHLWPGKDKSWPTTGIGLSVYPRFAMWSLKKVGGWGFNPNILMKNMMEWKSMGLEWLFPILMKWKIKITMFETTNQLKNEMKHCNITA